jgi:uroporphyrinogen decarboxylase
MDRKQDLFAALDCRQPQGRVPYWELEFHLWDAFSTRGLVLGEDYLRLSPAEQERALHTNAEIFIEVAELLHFSALSMPSQPWEVGPGHPAYYWLPEKARTVQARLLRAAAPPDLLLVANCSALLGIPQGAEYVPFAYRLFDSPGEIDALAEERLHEGIASAHRFADLGVEIGLSTTDLADNHSTFMNPRQLERYVWPYLTRWVEALKGLGMRTILHSDGNLNACLEAIASSGVDCLQAIDPTAGMDLLTCKRQLEGRLCLAGNLDCGLLLLGSPEAVYQAACGLIQDAMPGGGFIFGTSNAVQQQVPPENYRALARAWLDCGGYS